MRRLVVALVVFALPAVAQAAQSISDDTGRTWQVSEQVERVMAAGAPAEILLYTLAPERMVGWNHMPTEAQRAYMPDELEPRAAIPSLPDLESDRYDAGILALKPQMIIDYGDVKQGYVDLSQAVSERTGLPYPLFSGRLVDIPRTYRTLGRVLGVPERAERLAQASQDILKRYKGALARDGAAPRLYLTISPDGMLPAFANESWGEVAAWLGAQNVMGSVDLEHYTPIAFEDIKAADPDAILALNPGFMETMKRDPRWRALRAVRDGHVYAAPRLPFDWASRPPSVNRLLGVVRTRYAVAGKPFDETFYDDVQTLFKELYHWDIDRAGIDALVQ